MHNSNLWPKTLIFPIWHFQDCSCFSRTLCWSRLSFRPPLRRGPQWSRRSSPTNGTRWALMNQVWRHYPGVWPPERSAFYERLLLMCVNAGASFRRWRINTSLIQICHFHVCFVLFNWYSSRGGSLRDLEFDWATSDKYLVYSPDSNVCLKYIFKRNASRIFIFNFWRYLLSHIMSHASPWKP